MFDSAKLRVFRLSGQPGDNGIRCDVNGLSVDHIPLLRVSCEASGRRTFQLRPLDDINNALSLRYGLPIDFSRLKHEFITGEYNSRPGGPGTPTVREILSQKSFAEQREAGLEFLRKYGVLK